MRSDKDRLIDILDAIEKINSAINRIELHQLNELEYFGLIRCIEVIGEAANNLTQEFTKKYSLIPWNQIIKMRHVLVHHYFKVDEEKVEIVVQEYIPKLKEEILKIIDEL